MKRKLICSLLVTVCLVGTSLAQSLIRPKTSGDNLGTTTVPFGTLYADEVNPGDGGCLDFTASQIRVTTNFIATGTIVGSNTLAITGVATFSTNAVVTGQLRTTITKAAGTLTNGPAWTTTLPADAQTNTVIWVHVMSGTNHVAIPGFMVGTP